MFVPTVAVEELELVVCAVVRLFSCLLLGKRHTETHTHAQCTQVSTLGRLKVPEAYLLHGSELKSEIT